MTKHASNYGAAGLSRRDALRLFGAAGAAAFVASCGGDDGDGAPPSPPAGGGGLPTSDVDLRWLSNPDNKGFFEPWFERYNGEHPNIEITYDAIVRPEMADVVQLGAQNGNLHDVFLSPPGIPYGNLVSNGWVAPLDDHIPDIEEFKSRFRPGSLATSIYDGKLYNVPMSSAVAVQSLVYYHRQYMNDAGYDPESEPLTWDTFRDAAKKITLNGGGDYYGLVIGAADQPRLARWVSDLAARAGANTSWYSFGPFDWSTGEYVIAGEEHLAAWDLLAAMIDDGSLLPGFNSLKHPDAVPNVPNGNAGMVLAIANFASLWPRGLQGGNPDFDFGVGHPPTPDPATANKVGSNPGGAAIYWASAESPNLAVVGDMLAQLGTPELHIEYFREKGISGWPVFDGIYDRIDFSDNEKRAIAILEDVHATRPNALVRKPDASVMETMWKPVEPKMGVRLQGVLAGELDVKETLQELEDQSNAELDRAIKAAQDAGADITRDDWVFPNWDPTTDYLPEHYEEL